MIDLQQFCANDLDPREYLRQPWKRGQWVYATNGHIALRVLAADYPDAPETEAKVPDVGGLFDKTMAGRDLEYLLLPPVPKLQTCFDCDGKTKVRAIKCPDCNEGAFKHGEWIYECHNCKESPAGAGWEFLDDECNKQPHEVLRTCETCDGQGFSRQQGGIELGPAKYNPIYVAMFAALPQVRVCPGSAATDKNDGAKEVPAIFIFDGGHGLLMPYRY